MRTSFGRSIMSIWGWFVVGLSVALWLPMVAIVWLVTAPFDPGRYRAGYLFRKIGVFPQKLNPLWTFTVTGDIPSDPRRPYVVVANHESFVDLMLISHLKMEMKWLAKEELFRLPIAGWIMRLSGDISLTRGDRASSADAIAQCHDRLDKKVSVMVFPEGTRTRSGELQPFKDGAFRIAIDAQVPILPLAVHGTRLALRSGDWRLGDADAEVRVLEPISTEGMTAEDVPELRERIREIIRLEIEQMKVAT